MFVFSAYLPVDRWKSILCEVFWWRANNFLLVLHLFMPVSHHVRGKMWKQQDKQHSLFPKHFDTMSALGRKLYSPRSRLKKTQNAREHTTLSEGDTMSQGVKNTFQRKTQTPSRHLQYSEFMLLLLLLLSRFSRVPLCATPQTAAHQVPPPLGFSRQEHWSGLPFPSPVQESEKWKWSHSVLSDSSRPHGLQPTKLLCPWDFPGESTGVGCHSLLQHIC